MSDTTVGRIKLATIYIMALLYFSVGIKHFTDVDFFLSIMPSYLPWHRELVYISGFFEVLLAVLLVIKPTRKYAAIAIIALLLAVFPANIYLYTSEAAQQALGATPQDALIRMPFQIPLILFAYWHGQEQSQKWLDVTCIVLFIPTLVYFLTL